MATSTKPSSLTVRGQRISNRSNRRFLVVAVRPEPIRVTPEEAAISRGRLQSGVYVAFAEVLKRSDSAVTARRFQESQVGRMGFGTAVVLVDSVTGEEV